MNCQKGMVKWQDYIKGSRTLYITGLSEFGGKPAEVLSGGRAFSRLCPARQDAQRGGEVLPFAAASAIEQAGDSSATREFLEVVRGLLQDDLWV